MTKTKRKDASKAKPTPKADPPAPPVLGIVPKGELREIKIADIHDPPGEPDRQARPDDGEQIAEVARSLREVGQLQPVMVECEGHGDKTIGPYMRVFGRRRIAAAKSIGRETVLAIVVEPLAPDARRTIVAVENIQRKDLTAAEEHLAVAELLDLQAIDAALQVKASLALVSEWAGRAAVMDDAIAKEMKADSRVAKFRTNLLRDHKVRARACDMVAAMLAKSPTWVRDRMYIGRLGPKGRALVLAEKLPILHARELAKVADPEIREDLAQRYAAGGDSATSDTEPGSFDELRGEVSERLFNLSVVPWRLDVPVGVCPPCDGCPNNSQTNPGLFDHGGEVSNEMRAGVGFGYAKVTAAGVCTDHSCYARKLSVAKGLLTNVAKKVVDQKGKPADVRNAVTILQSKAINEKVESRRQLKKHNDGRLQRGPSKPSAAELAKQARYEADIKWRRAMEDRAIKLEPTIAAVLAKKPGAWAVFKIFTETKLFRSTRGRDKKAARTVESPMMLSLLKELAAPSWESILTMEKDCGVRYGLLQNWYDGPSGMADKIAAALGVQVGPAPTIEDFMPKASKPAKEGKSPKAKPITPSEDLEEEGE